MNQEIELFIERAEILRQCSFFNPKHKIKSNMTYKRGRDVKITSSTPPRESIESLGMRIRIFIAQKEPICFDKFVRSLIKVNPENKEKYDEYLRVYKGIVNSSPMVIREEKDGKVSEYTGYDFMWDQLYGPIRGSNCLSSTSSNPKVEVLMSCKPSSATTTTNKESTIPRIVSQNLTIDEFSMSDGVVPRKVMIPSTIGFVELSTMFWIKPFTASIKT